MFKKREKQIPENADTAQLLLLAEQEKDPAFRYRLLSRAQVMSPDSLAVCRALLLHGRVHEGKAHPGSFEYIKCYLLHVFEHPEAYEPKDMARKARELFDAPDVRRCLALTDDAAAFLKDYLGELCRQYVRVFITGSSSNLPSFLGFPLRSAAGGALRRPMADACNSMALCPYLTDDEKHTLLNAWMQACHLYLQGNTEGVNALLIPEARSFLRGGACTR